MTILPQALGARTGPDGQATHYPFRAPPPAAVRDLVADVYVLQGGARPLALRELHGFDRALTGDWPAEEEWAGPGAHAADVAFFEGGLTRGIDTTNLRYRTCPFGDLFRLHEWSPELGAVPVVRVLQYAAWPSEAVAPTPGAHMTFSPALAVDDRCVADGPPRLTSAGVAYTSGRAGHGRGLSFAAGYNVAFTPKAIVRNGRRVTQVTVSAAPGGGAGRYPGCDPADVVVRRLGGVVGDKWGNVGLAASGCHWARPSLSYRAGGSVAPTPATIVVGNDCAPCLECGDVLAAEDGVLSTWDFLAATDAKREAALAAYVELLARWAEEKGCRESQPVTINAIAYRDTYLDVAVVVCNTTGECLRDVTLDVEVGTLPEAKPLVPDPTTVFLSVTGQDQRPYDPHATGGGHPLLWDGIHYACRVDAISPQGQATLRFRAALPEDAQSPAMARIGAYTNITHGGASIQPAVKVVPIR